jgi:exonuclease III
VDPRAKAFQQIREALGPGARDMHFEFASSLRRDPELTYNQAENSLVKWDSASRIDIGWAFDSFDGVELLKLRVANVTVHKQNRDTPMSDHWPVVFEVIPDHS